ncbi:hypothetical protein OUA51_15870 [Edwardsiella ictaluri]|uniref:Uncharacterized protein n=1 Tax=Edwardsiella ictaluri TaxID=67780 RepID=A0ABY8GG46_EDWIC|nr:hypothetical protein [Edwardsiella ictaluri]WFN96475.1 hypothetical protein MAY91_17490 [Edwardsiella ictaluri]
MAVNIASHTQNKQANRFVDSPIVNCAIAVARENNIDVLMNEDRLSNGLYSKLSSIFSIGVPVALLYISLYS